MGAGFQCRNLLTFQRHNDRCAARAREPGLLENGIHVVYTNETKALVPATFSICGRRALRVRSVECIGDAPAVPAGAMRQQAAIASGYASCFMLCGAHREAGRVGRETAPSCAAHAQAPASPSDFLKTMNKTQEQPLRLDLIELARESGMAVLLDARIGREQYVSVSGSLAALARFAHAVRGDAEADGSNDDER